VCFLGGTRYTSPLDATSERKFRVISPLGELFIIGFSTDFRLRYFTEHARFYLLPQLSLPICRYIELFVLGQILVFWLIVRHRIQLVITQSPYEGFIAAVALKLAGLCGYQVRLVVEVHGDFEESLFLYRRVRFPECHRRLMKRVVDYSIKRADLLRVISNSTKEQTKRWAPGKAIIQFPAWTDIEVFLRTDIQRSGKNPPIILYAGILTPLKGVHHLINAFALIAKDYPAARLVIVGKDQNKTYTVDLKRQINRLGVYGRVQLIGSQPQSELAMWMAKSSVLVLPSMSEGLGRVIIEAMATGTPVIGSRVGGIPELIEEGVRGFLVLPGDEKALAEKLRWILDDPVKSITMGEAGRAFVARVFSTKSYVEGHQQMFKLAHRGIDRSENAYSPL
jgi:glycosyltransferase involved in cell wall biosynthesis